MNTAAIQGMAVKLWRGFGWRLRILTVACLAVGACIVSSSIPSTPKPVQQLDAPPPIAAGQLGFTPTSSSFAELRGTTNVGQWKCRSVDIHGQIVLNADASALDALFDQIQAAAPNNPAHAWAPPLAFSVRSPPSADISVPVMSLHGDSNGMDRDMQKALKAAEYPAIEFVFQQLQQASIQWDSANNRADVKLSIVGKLTMAGVGRPIAMEVTVRRDTRAHFLARAQTTLLMTDFGVTPPVALLGLIKGGNRVDVMFDLDLLLTHDSPATRPAL